ncbi:MAG: YtxH domain-containing protein [Elusimicrobia bacterium]|nr:YtxH domain-containing protein [Elusimicrobiota bacterium]
MSENRDAADWTLIGGAALGAVVAILVGPALIGGAAVGLGLGLLISPKSGRETRRVLAAWFKTQGAKISRSKESASESPDAPPVVDPALPKPPSAAVHDGHRLSSR